MTKGLVHRKPRIIFLEQATIWAAKQSMICQTVNLSETGLLLIPPFSSEPGLNLRVDIPLPGLQRPLAIPGVLVREGEHNGDYVWGVRFELISADAQKFLRQFLEEQMAKQSPEKPLEQLLPEEPLQSPEEPLQLPAEPIQLPAEPLQTSVPQQVVITPTEPVVQASTPSPARPKHKPIDRSAVRRVPVKRRGTASQPAIARDVTGPHQLPPQEVQAADPQPIIALEPEDLGSQPDVALAAPPPSRIPTYSGPLDGEAPPVTAPQIVPAPKPLTVEPPLAAPPPRTGSHPVVSPAPAAVAPPVASAPATTPASPATDGEPQLSVTMPADELLLDRPPVQEEGTPIFDDVPEWSDKSDVPRSAKDRDLMEEVDKADNKLDDIFDDAIKQLDLSDSWAERGFSKKKKKKKGWF